MPSVKTLRNPQRALLIFFSSTKKAFPLLSEAKAEDKSPLIGKEQARKYARSQNCCFIILSNRNLH